MKWRTCTKPSRRSIAEFLPLSGALVIFLSLFGCSSLTQYRVEVGPDGADPKTSIPCSGDLAQDLRGWMSSGFELTIEPKHLSCVYKAGPEEDPFDSVGSVHRLPVDYNEISTAGSGSNSKTLKAYGQLLRKHCSPYSESRSDYARHYSRLLRYKAKSVAPEYEKNLKNILRFRTLSEFELPEAEAQEAPKELDDFLAWLMKAARAKFRGKLLGYDAEFSFQFIDEGRYKKGSTEKPLIQVVSLMDNLDGNAHDEIVKTMDEIYNRFSCSFGTHDIISYDTGLESSLTHFDRIAVWRVGNVDLALVQHAETRLGGNVKAFLWPHVDGTNSRQNLCYAAQASDQLSKVDPDPSVLLACINAMDRDISDGGSIKHKCNEF